MESPGGPCLPEKEDLVLEIEEETVSDLGRWGPRSKLQRNVRLDQKSQGARQFSVKGLTCVRGLGT